jgi:hypothetical protein
MSSSSSAFSYQTTQPQPQGQETTIGDYVELVIKALYELNQGYGSSENDIIRWIVKNNRSAEPDMIMMAINRGIYDEEFVRLFGPNGPIANEGVVGPVLNIVTERYEPIDDVVQAMIDEYPYLISGQFGPELLFRKIRQMVDAGILEADNKLRVRAKPNVIYEGERRSEDEEESMEVEEQTSTGYRPVPLPQQVTRAEKAPRTPSPYNEYMEEEIGRVKRLTPGMDHKAAFRAAAANWKNSVMNPKNA